MSFTIDVAKDFSPQPWGRYIKDDPKRSAEAFRTIHLVPALKRMENFTVDLSGSNRFSSSFLEEAFGGLIRAEGFTVEDLKRMEVKHSLLPSVVEEVDFYIERAAANK